MDLNPLQAAPTAKRLTRSLAAAFFFYFFFFSFDLIKTRLGPASQQASKPASQPTSQLATGAQPTRTTTIPPTAAYLIKLFSAPLCLAAKDSRQLARGLVG